MTSKKNTKKTFITSVLSLILCLAMLVGTTFAWFTDSVTSTNNIIKSGNLDVEFYYQNSESTDWKKVDSSTNVFKTETLWEPGHVEVIKLKVANEGSLALKYQLGVNIVSETGSTNVNGEKFKLSDHIYYGIVDGEQDYDRAQAIAAVKDDAKKLNESSMQPSTLEAGESSYECVTMVVYMPETVGNEANYAKDANVPTIHLGLNVVATQFTSESDSFGSDYDETATYPLVKAVNVPAGTTSATELREGDVSVYIPAGAEEGQYTLEITNKSVNTDANSYTTVSYDISLYKDGVKVSDVMYPVEIQVGTLLDVTNVTHNGNTIAGYKYDALTGIVSFETDSFSPFAVTYKTLAGSDIEVSDGKIVGGIFEEMNPADIDPSLKEDNSEYIAVNYEKDGKTYYVVNERATTVILASLDTEYTSANGNYTVKTVADNGMYAEFSALKNNDFNTVYILPGTYNAATTVTISSSMDIIGLGNAKDIKIVKVSSSDSNRHLFNCTGTKSDYIEVTIRNLSLDATANTTNGKDNAAVQCIRKTKVKCYDLIINKSTTNLSAVAFYVNGNNAVDGVKYPAYMYVENTVLNTTRTVGIVTTNGTYKFYHNGLTYNNGSSEYTNNSGSIKKLVMEQSDWEW